MSVQNHKNRHLETERMAQGNISSAINGIQALTVHQSQLLETNIRLFNYFLRSPMLCCVRSVFRVIVLLYDESPPNKICPYIDGHYVSLDC